MLAAAKRLNIRDHFIWVASDGWGRQHKLVEGLEDVAEGALTVDLQSNLVPGFDDYMISLTPSNNLRNPWYGDFWQEIFNCVLPQNLQSTTGTSYYYFIPRYFRTMELRDPPAAVSTPQNKRERINNRKDRASDYIMAITFKALISACGCTPSNHRASMQFGGP